ncbi:MAG TPA: alpha/beta hydrolase [Vicinamibacterales bacterium]|jgi:pimeloyl-ACP methyl ester carboxylesterase
MTDADLTLQSSPLAADGAPVRIRYREAGAGPAVVVLHGGWGYEIYPFDRQIAALSLRHRVIVPDRTGYGGSGRLSFQPTDFHERAAGETLALLDALGIERAILWGHSDGAVIALRLGLMAPARVDRIVAEATHFFRRKPASRAFFETMRDRPDALGARVAATLAHEHGENDWRPLLAINGDAWLRIADEAQSDRADLYDDRLSQLSAPVLLIHGARDPRTEPGELTALRDVLERRASLDRMRTSVVVLDDGGHSPHSEKATADRVTQAAVDFLSATVSVR